MRFPRPRFTVRRWAALVAVLAVAIGLYGETRRAARFHARADFYLSEERNVRAAGEASLRAGRDTEAGKTLIRKADRYRELSRWYSAHALWGGAPPPDQGLVERLHAGWPIAEAYQRAEMVVIGKVVRISWTGSDVSLRMQKTLKGEPKESDVVTVSTRTLPYKPARLKRGDEWLVFYVEDSTDGNRAMQMFEKTAENLKALGVETP